MNPSGVANSSNQKFFNPGNDITKPGSNSKRIESRKGVLSRKDSINKNSFYLQKGKSPEYNLSKPTVQGSSEVPQGYFNKNAGGYNQPAPTLPVLNNPYQSSVAKNSAVGGLRNKSLPPGNNYKYGGGGIGGGGIGGGGDYSGYEQSTQGAQGSIGSSGKGMNGDGKLPSVQSRGGGAPGYKGPDSRGSIGGGYGGIGATKQQYNPPVGGTSLP